MGPIKDIDINLEEGKIGAIILPGQGGKVMGLFGRDEEIVVPWEKIVRIGVDVILVDLRHPQDQRYEGQGGYHNDEKYW